MNFHAMYRASFYLMLFFATLVLSVDATDVNRLAMLYPLVVAMAGGVAFLTVDRYPKLGLSTSTSNLLGLASIGMAAVEYFSDENLLLLAVAHWLVYLQLIKMFRPKTSRDDWYLFLIGLMQVLVGGVMSQSDTVGFALAAWGLCSLWVLSLFTLSREAERGKPSIGTKTFPATDPAAPYPGLIDMPFILASVRVAATTLALGGIIFLAMPRRGSTGDSVKGEAVAKHLTGFDDEVQLGQLGEILENDSLVMTIELTDSDGARLGPTGERLWRGVGMARYERGRWRKLGHRDSPIVYDPASPREHRLLIQRIKLEASDNPVLFCLRPVLGAEMGNRQLAADFNAIDGSLTRSNARPTSVEYTAYSSDDPRQSQPKEMFPLPRILDDLLSIGPDLKAQLRPIALEAIGDADPADRLAVARRIESYLRDSGKFTYTLQMDVVDPAIDPVADFLINRREGHCEYFASAQTLLLRALDIPARLVNGFKGADWNDLAGVYNVRQKHAHSWCEVLLTVAPRRGDTIPEWATLDPTPATERDRSIALVGGVSPSLRQIADFIRYAWTFYVVGFNFERQQRFLYGPVRRLFTEAKQGFQMMGHGLRVAFDWLFHFPNIASFFSVRGFLVTFGSMVLLLGLSAILIMVIRRLMRRWRGARVDHSTLAVGVLFYRRLVALLDECGLERPPAETPREFARRASSFLAGHGSGSESVADVPPLVVDAYYRIRFGHADLDDDVLRQVESRLDALEAGLHPAPA